MPGVRGRLDIETSLKRALFPQALAACRYDELSHDVRHNQIIRADASPARHHRPARFRTPWRSRGGCTGGSKASRTFLSRATLFGVSSCIATTATTRSCWTFAGSSSTSRWSRRRVGISSRTSRENEHKMRRLFERFVRNFYRRNSGYRVSAPSFGWVGQDESPSGTEFLPGMHTDIVLASSDRTHRDRHEVLEEHAHRQPG